ncbi:MAG: hypothetical protein EP344_07270 [Bacteroidetes bacterium]|nr:MAG: hypothetical protein EP344_07270 [Bacteroidota bacterium]
MKTNPFVLTLVLTALFACRTPEITLDPALATAEAMPVKGRNGFRIGQVIRYGEFHTDKVKRGWTKGYDVPFRVRFRKASEKLRYTQYGPENMQADVSCISKFKSTELQLVRDFFSVPLEYRNFFAGNIHVAGSQANWDFVLHNPDGDFLRERSAAGFAQNGTHRLEIEAIREVKGQPEWMNALTVYGHAFRFDGKTVGAVSTVNKGTVWIEPGLDAETRTVIAALATGLLLRTDVETEAIQPVQ